MLVEMQRPPAVIVEPVSTDVLKAVERLFPQAQEPEDGCVHPMVECVEEGTTIHIRSNVEVDLTGVASRLGLSERPAQLAFADVLSSWQRPCVDPRGHTCSMSHWEATLEVGPDGLISIADWRGTPEELFAAIDASVIQPMLPPAAVFSEVQPTEAVETQPDQAQDLPTATPISQGPPPVIQPVLDVTPPVQEPSPPKAGGDGGSFLKLNLKCLSWPAVIIGSLILLKKVFEGGPRRRSNPIAKSASVGNSPQDNYPPQGDFRFVDPGPDSGSGSSLKPTVYGEEPSDLKRAAYLLSKVVRDPQGWVEDVVPNYPAARTWYKAIGSLDDSRLPPGDSRISPDDLPLGKRGGDDLDDIYGRLFGGDGWDDDEGGGG